MMTWVFLRNIEEGRIVREVRTRQEKGWLCIKLITVNRIYEGPCMLEVMCNQVF